MCCGRILGQRDARALLRGYDEHLESACLRIKSLSEKGITESTRVDDRIFGDTFFIHAVGQVISSC
jgi:hypothetical protein